MTSISRELTWPLIWISIDMYTASFLKEMLKIAIIKNFLPFRDVFVNGDRLKYQ